MLDLLKYEKRSKKKKLTELEKEYEYLLIENNKGILVKSKNNSRARKVSMIVSSCSDDILHNL